MFRFTAEKMNQNAFTSAPCAEAASAILYKGGVGTLFDNN